VRRILLLVTVAAVMAALVVIASPAIAAPGGQSDEQRAMPRETGVTPSQPPPLFESAPPRVPHGIFERPAYVEPEGRFPTTGPPLCTDDPSQPGYACEELTE
jgi:hypothetical protein